MNSRRAVNSDVGLLMISRQTQKYHLSLAGEFFVAAELQRRGVSAAVTYGNAKSADVVAFSVSGEKAVVIEVKSTSQATWVVGGFTPLPSPKPWLFVHLPVDKLEAPSYYVVLQSELHDILNTPRRRVQTSIQGEAWG